MTAEITDINLSEIDIPEDRVRSFDPDEAAGLAATIAEIGLQHPIRLRAVGNRFRLVAGCKRLEAVRLLGWKAIPYTLSSATNDDKARIEEVLENLARPKLVKLDRYRHLYELKVAYERLHPEAQRGGDRGNQFTGGKLQTLEFVPDEAEQTQIFGFTRVNAEKIGLSQSAIFAAVKIWKDLSVASRQRCAGTWLADHQAGLKQLSEQSHTDQAKVLDILFGEKPQATNVPNALTILETGGLKPIWKRRSRRSGTR